MPATHLCLYRVKRGSERPFQALLKRHWPTLRRLGLATDDAPLVLRGRDGEGRPFFIELLTWRRAEDPNRAHELPDVMAIWERMGRLCEKRGALPAMEFPRVQRLAFHER